MLNLNNQTTATWDEPIDMLYACHGKVKCFCGQLKMLPEYLAENDVNTPAREAIKQICTYFNQAAPLHHEDEEQNFFPTLLQYAPQAQSDIDELNRQHQILHDNWTTLRTQLEALLNGERNDLDLTVLQQFVHGYDVHTAIEEPLFDLGRQAIPQAERQAIGKIMAARRHA
ncbi:hemerythrin domain-containing protein [Kingella negevensis]|nr:hemerythrin domain-containing protein [Kingella negevensis]WII92874.1 hemerythrin domain-containing protein [Kingella negevensis]